MFKERFSPEFIDDRYISGMDELQDSGICHKLTESGPSMIYGEKERR